MSTLMKYDETAHGDNYKGHELDMCYTSISSSVYLRFTLVFVSNKKPRHNKTWRLHSDMK